MAYEELNELLRRAQNIVFFGGAGVSTESGFPDFRGSQGLYRQDEPEEEAPETILSIGFFIRHPQAFYRYYRSHMLYPDAQPNGAHRALARLEQEGKLRAVITQNIDGLHQAAGSRRVIELHGCARRNFCIRCGRSFGVKRLLEQKDVPHCPCGGLVRPDIVLYGEGLSAKALDDAEEAIVHADLLIVGGTSLTVQPAASLVDCFEGEHLVIINRAPTPYDGLAELIIRDPIGEVLEGAQDD